MANNPNLKSKSFTSKYSYERDILDTDRLGSISNRDVSNLHNTISLNDKDKESGQVTSPLTYGNSFNVPSKNSSIGLNNTPKSTISKAGGVGISFGGRGTNGLSALFGNDPSTTYPSTFKDD